jgi:DNA-binding response OmpR family regulator
MSRKILLVEDDESLRKALCLRLESFGYKTIVACDVASAASLAAKRKPDVSLIDINLPDGIGFSIAKQILKSPYIDVIPVVFTSAINKPEYREVARTYTPIPLLEKPFTGTELLNSLELSQSAGSGEFH